MNKIIREKFVIDLRKMNYYDAHHLILSKIQEIKCRAEYLAARLDYPLNSYRSEIFDVDYSCSYFERVTPAKNINNYKEMIAESIVTGLPAKYSYIIDGEHDKNGMKISIDSTPENK